MRTRSRLDEDLDEEGMEALPVYTEEELALLVEHVATLEFLELIEHRQAA